MMHLPAGMAVRGIIELGSYLIDKSNSGKLKDIKYWLYTKKTKPLIGIGVPIADTIGEYIPVYKITKDDIVSIFSGGDGNPISQVDQANDAAWFLIGYFSPELTKTTIKLIKKGLEKLIS